MFAGRLALVFVAAALCLAGRTADAQSGPMGYWTPSWLGFGGNLNAGQGANTGSGFASLDDGGAVSSTRYNFPNWFVGVAFAAITTTALRPWILAASATPWA